MALVTVEAVTCDKDTIKYMLVQVCGYGYKKRSNTDQYFQVMSHEDVNKRFNDMVNSQLIILSDPSRHVLGMDDGMLTINWYYSIRNTVFLNNLIACCLNKAFFYYTHIENNPGTLRRIKFKFHFPCTCLFINQ